MYMAKSNGKKAEKAHAMTIQPEMEDLEPAESDKMELKRDSIEYMPAQEGEEDNEEFSNASEGTSNESGDDSELSEEGQDDHITGKSIKGVVSEGDLAVDEGRDGMGMFALWMSKQESRGQFNRKAFASMVLWQWTKLSLERQHRWHLIAMVYARNGHRYQDAVDTRGDYRVVSAKYPDIKPPFGSHQIHIRNPVHVVNPDPPSPVPNKLSLHSASKPARWLESDAPIPSGSVHHASRPAGVPYAEPEPELEGDRGGDSDENDVKNKKKQGKGRGGHPHPAARKKETRNARGKGRGRGKAS